MPFGGDGTTWITGILMALTVVVGLLGISRDHHRADGKLTRLGWGLVAAIILLGVVTFISGQRDKRIADEEELADSAERNRQFQTQMNTLRGVTGSLSELQSNMRGSLAEQQRLSGVANRNLSASEALQRQAQANTSNVLRRVFQESNRVAAERVAIFVTFECRLPDEDSDSPRLHEVHLMVEDRIGDQVVLSSNQKLQMGLVSIFHGFLGDLGPFESFEAWRNATISIVLLAGTPAADGHRIDDILRVEELRRQRGGRDARPAECIADVRLLLNGRRVLNSRESLVYTGNGQYGRVFSPLRVDPRRIPRFAG